MHTIVPRMPHRGYLPVFPSSYPYLDRYNRFQRRAWIRCFDRPISEF